nr:hypothetical protein [Tanacetum cinerariifolium]
MSAKRTSWNEFSSSMASAVICLSTGRKFNFSKYIFDSLVKNVDSSSKFYMYPRFLQLMIRAQVGYLSSHTTKYSSPALTQKIFANMRRVGKGFFGVETPLFESTIVAQQADVVADEVVVVIPTPPPSPIAQPSSPPQQQQPSQPTHDDAISLDLLHTLLETYTTLTRKVEALKEEKLERKNQLKVSGLRRLRKREIIANIDADEDVILKDVAAIKKTAKIEKDADVQGRPEESQAQIYKIDLEHAEKVLSMQDDELDPAELKEVVEVVTTAKLMTEVVTATTATITLATTPITAATTPITTAIITAAPNKGKGITVEEPKPLKKQAQIEQDEAYVRELEAELNKNINWDDVIEQMDYFKGTSYDDIRLIFEKYFNSNVAFLEKTKEQLEEEESRALKRTSESLEEKATKKQTLDEEVEELKKHLHIVPNDDDDVYTDATPLALKVPIVDYAIYSENNKLFYKIIRADGSHQQFLSFLTY